TGGDPPEHRHIGRRRPSLIGEVTPSVGAADGLQVITGPASCRGALGLRGGGGGDGGTLGEPDLDSSRAVGITAQEALALQRRELMRHAAGAGQPDRVADLAHARRISAALHVVADDLENAALAWSEPVVVGWTIGERMELGHDRLGGPAGLAPPARPPGGGLG